MHYFAHSRRTCLFTAAAALMGGGPLLAQIAAGPRKAAAKKPAKKVSMKTISGSPSLLLRATHLLSVRVDAAKSTEWTKNPTFGVQRSTRLVLELTRVWKGNVRQAPGSRVSLEVTEHATGMGRDTKMPGVWSEQPMTPGTEFVAFIEGSGDDAAELLNDPSCKQLLPPAAVLADVQLAWECASEGVDTAETIIRARKAASRLQNLFPVYLWSGFGPQILENQRNFELAVALLVAPDWTPLGHAAMASATYSVAGGAPGLSSSNIHLLLRGFFRLLGESVSAEVQQVTASSYLPALIGLRGGVPRSATEVFAGADSERQVAEKAVERLNVDELRRWLAAR